MPMDIPMEQNLRLGEKLRPKTEETKGEEKTKAKKNDEPLKNPEVYRNLVGRLSYLTMTRFDICYVVQVLSQFLVEPRKSHMDAANRVLYYLKSNPGLGIILSSSSEMKLECYCDSDWGTCGDTRRSVIGYAVKLGNSLVSWKSKKQTTVSRSSAEAE